MTAIKIIFVLLLIYLGSIVIFESRLGYSQPQNDNTLVLTMVDGEGEVYQRVLRRIEVDGRAYVAVNHWPRSWYYRVLDFPEVSVTYDDVSFDATAVPVTDDDEAAEIDKTRPLGLAFRIRTGFPPRYFVRLDPKLQDSAMTSWPIELESADEVADIKLLDDAVVNVSNLVTECAETGTLTQDQCRCQYQDEIVQAESVFTQTIEKHPDWSGQSILWWKDESKAYSYNLNMQGLERQFTQDCP